MYLSLWQVETLDASSVITPHYRLLTYIKENTDLYKLLLQNSSNNEFFYGLIQSAMEFLTEKSELLQTDMHGYEDYYFAYVISGAVTIIRKWINSGLKESPTEIAELTYEISGKCLSL